MATVWVPGSCGELAQGLWQGKPYLITCPIACGSAVTVVAGQQAISKIGSKTRLAVEKTFEYLGWKGSARIEVHSQIPVGKGMASSSADIAAACQAAALSIGYKLTPEEVSRLAVEIEPTDAVFYPGISCYDHLQGHLYQKYERFPRLQIVVFDLGGQVDTQEFNRRPDLVQLNYGKQEATQEAFALISKGLKEGKSSLIGEGAMKSALANQSILVKPQLTDLITIARTCGAIGVNVAHSGTVVGCLFEENAALTALTICQEQVQSCLPGLRWLMTVPLVGGGMWTVKDKGGTR